MIAIYLAGLTACSSSCAALAAARLASQHPEAARRRQEEASWPQSRKRIRWLESARIVQRWSLALIRLRYPPARPMLAAMDGIVIRAATAGDATFLQDMLVEAANTPSHPGRSRAGTLADPAVARYLEGWPRATDLGRVAIETGGRPIGAAWLRFFTEADPGYGFVRAGIPELAVGVAAGRRGHGVGRALLRAVADAARQLGLEHISLSVERANPAAALYYAEGYRVVESREHADTMLLDLRPSEPASLAPAAPV